MALDQMQAVMTLLSYAVQGRCRPHPPGDWVSFLKNYHLAMPDKTQPGHSGAYQWGNPVRRL